MANIKVKDLSDTSSITIDNEIMVLTNNENNLVQNITIDNFLENIISPEENNTIIKASDGKLFVNSVENEFNEIRTNIGTLNDLDTLDKTNLVGAINEIAAVAEPSLQYSTMNNSKALKTGEISTDTTILADIKSYAHSTFDLSKFTVVGTPIVTDDGIVTAGANSYLKKELTISATASKFRIKCGFKYSISSNYQDVFSFRGNAFGPRIDIEPTGRVSLILRDFENPYHQNFLYLNATNFTQDKWYYFDWEFDNTTSSVKVYDENGSLVVSGSNTPTTSLGNMNWAYTFSELYIGYSHSGNIYYNSEIDLKQFSIIVDGVEVFSGNKTGIDTIKPDDYTVVGLPTISADGIATGFGASNYVTIPNLNISNATDFIYITTWFKLGEITNGINQVQNWSSTYTDTRINVYQRATQQDAIEYAIYHGTTIVDNTHNFSAPNLNTWYQMKFEYKNEAWKVYYRTLTSNWQLTRTMSDTTPVTISGVRPIGWENASSFLQNGEIDLNGLQVYVNGNLIYQPCLKIPYTLSKTGSKIVDSVYRDRISDMYEQFGYAPYYTLSDNDFTLPMGEIYGMIERNLYSGIIGQTVFSLDPLNNDNLHLLDGALLSGDGVYKSFIDNHVKPLYSSNPSRFVTEVQWQASVSSYGVCGYYVYDSVNNTVRLPKITGFVEGTLVASALGELTEAGLPNITGAFRLQGTEGSSDVSGAFNAGTQGGSWGDGHNDHAFNPLMSFDASRSSSVYGNSTTVQPQSIKGYMYIVCGNSATGYYPTNTSGIITDLNNKTDKSMVDGQWIGSFYTVADSAAVRQTDQTFSLSDYLPNDGYNYEVLVSATCTSGSSSGNYAHVSIKTDIISAGENDNPQQLCHAYTRASSAVSAAGSTITVVGTSRTLTVYGYDTTNQTGTYNLRLLGYRRIGTNS